MQGIRGRVNALHLVEHHALVGEGILHVFELIVPPFLLEDLAHDDTTPKAAQFVE